MATKPGLVPDEAEWLVMEHRDKEPCGWFPNKRRALEWIFDQRTSGDQTVYDIYAPDSRHSFALTNKIEWERSHG